MLTTNGTFSDLVSSILGLFNVILPVLAAAATVLFMYGAVRYVLSSGKKERSAMLWSLIALFVLLSMWGLLRILTNSLL